LILQCEDGTGTANGRVSIRVIALNDSFSPVDLDHRLLVGPNPATAPALPVSVEPSFPEEHKNITTLNPWCLYGRERTFEGLRGEVTFHAYLLSRSEDALLVQGPGDATALLTSADPLSISFG